MRPRPLQLASLALLALVLAGCDSDGGDSAGDAPDASPTEVDASAAVPDATPPSPDAALPAADAGPAVLTSTASFTTAVGGLCGLGFDTAASEIWVYPCSGATLHGFTTAGVATTTLPRPGEAADDVDVTFTPAAITVGVNDVAASALVFVNGEAGPVDLHLPETAGSTPLATAFGGSHVVGGAYHAARGTFFVIQDRVPASMANTIAELDVVTGAVVGSFSSLPAIDVNFGDLEVCQSTGHLFLVSSIDANLVELTPTGALVAEHPLPGGVSGSTGLGLAPGGQAWVASGNLVQRLEGVPCP